MGKRVLIAILAAVTWNGLALGESNDKRLWTDDTGKHKTEAEFVRLNDGEVVLRKGDGEEVTVALTKLSQEDRDVAQALEKARTDRVAVERTSRRFLQLLRQSNREGAEELITARARELWDAEQSPIKNIPNVDRGSKPRIRDVEIDEMEASVVAMLRYQGKNMPATLHLRYEDGNWLLHAATGEDEEGNELHFSFEGDQRADAGSDYVSDGPRDAESPDQPAVSPGSLQPISTPGREAGGKEVKLEAEEGDDI